MFLTRLKTGAIVLLASCAMASLTALVTKPAQAHQDDGRPVTALAGGDPESPQDADAAAKAAKPTEAGGDNVVQRKDRLFTPDRTLMYLNVYSTDPRVDRSDLIYRAHDLSFRLPWIGSTGAARYLSDRISVMRIRLDPDRMRAHKLSFEDIWRAVRPSGFFRTDDWLDEATSKVFINRIPPTTVQIIRPANLSAGF